LYKSPANTLFVGKNVVFVPECHSTNTLATQLSQNSSASEGTVIITHYQTAGRGQRGNAWEAEPGLNLTLSLILKPGFLMIRHQFLMNIMAALAVKDLLTEFIPADISIKWPNDILVHKKKICGILIENQLQGQSIQSSVVGIGLNVNQVDFEFDSATSIQREAKRHFVLGDLFEKLLGYVEARYLQLKQNKSDDLKAEYLKNLYRRGERHTYADDTGTFTGEIVGVDDEGKLAVNVGNQMRYFQVKEIKYL
jgi:BirA family transcriptional regulator, biotin operon repressor / biotin---[acetyl-CoA-carboxylase] ligase